MKRFFPYVILFFVLVFPFCGKKGPIYPPVEKIPKNVEGFKILQRGDAIVLTWLNPSAYIDGSPMPHLLEIEVWILIEEKEAAEEFAPFSEEHFVDEAEILAVILEEKFSDYRSSSGEDSQGMRFDYRFKLEGFGSRRLSFGVKVKDDRGRFTDFSQLLSIEPQVVALAPDRLSAVVYKDKIEISWDPPVKNIDQSQPPNLSGYNIYRSSNEGEVVRLNSLLLNEDRYEDRNFVFGNLYRYFVRSCSTDVPPLLESQDSEPLEILAEDTFPPEPPTGLVAIAGENFIALSWDPNRETDLDGYKIFRKEEGNEEFIELTPERVQENSYADANVKKTKRYEYTVAALDRFGNISKKSDSVTAIY